jgi:hypothetical protein
MGLHKWNNISNSSFIVNTNGAFTTATVAVASDNVRPSNAAYVSKSGNDVTGNGSRAYPYKTISKAYNTHINSSGGVIIIGAGTYREGSLNSTNNFGKTFIADVRGSVTLDLTGISSLLLNNNDVTAAFDGINVRNCSGTLFPISGPIWIRYGRFERIATFITSSNNVERRFEYCEFDRITTLHFVAGSTSFQRYFSKNTVSNCINVTFAARSTGNIGFFGLIDSVFFNSNIWVGGSNAFNPEYCVFSTGCMWRLNASQGTIPTQLPPTVTAGYTNYATISALIAAFNAAFSVTYVFSNTLVVDPLENNASLGDLTIAPSSPAANLAYDGLFAGSTGPTAPVNFNNLMSSTNFTNTAGVLSPTTDALASLVTRVVDLGAEYELDILPITSIIADRNGDAIDYESDLSATTIAVGGSMVAETPYRVEGASIVWAGNTLAVNDCFTATAANLTFTSTGGGVVREVVQAPNRFSVQMRVKSTLPAAIGSATALTVNSVYIVVTGSILHNGTTYNVGESFDAGAITLFTGTGTVSEVFASGDAYFPYIVPRAPIRCNRVGNVGTGAISKGNGDPTYDTTSANQFRVFARYVQITLTLQSDNLA